MKEISIFSFSNFPNLFVDFIAKKYKKIIKKIILFKDLKAEKSCLYMIKKYFIFQIK